MRLRTDEFCRRHRARVKMALIDVQSHRLQLQLQLQRRLSAVVGQKQELLSLVLQPFHKLRNARQQSAAPIDDTIHITDITFFCSQFFHKHPSFFFHFFFVFSFFPIS